MVGTTEVPTMVYEWIRPTANVELLKMDFKDNRNDRHMAFYEVLAARLQAFFDHSWHYENFRLT